MEALRPGDPHRVGSYRLLARLGTGGMGVVYFGRSPGGRAVAVKVVRDSFAADFQFRARFRREVAAARSVTGVSTAVVLDADPEADRPWLVTAFLPGLTLREAVHTVGPLPPPTLRVLAAAVAEALVDIHRAGLVHRDLKPGNVMVTADGIRVIDFGIARPEDATAITRVGAVIGTPGFMSPEQVSGAGVGPPSDIFSLGSVLVYAATGQEPFRSDAVAVTLHRVRNVETDLGAVADPWLRGLVAACLRADPARRPTAADLLDRAGAVADADWLPPLLAEEIDRRAAAVTDPPPGAPAEGSGHISGPTIEPPVTGAPRPRRRLLIGGAAAVVAVAAGGVALLSGGDEPVTAPPVPALPAQPSTVGPPPRAVERWRARVSDFYPRQVYATAGAVIAWTPEAELVALDTATGRELWRHPATLVGAVSGGSVFEAQNTNPELALLDPVSGAERWSVPAVGLVRLARCGEIVCFGYAGLRAVSVADGRSLWSAAVDLPGGVVDAAGVPVAIGNAGITGLDPSTGRVRWQHSLARPMYTAAGGGIVVVVDQQRGLHAFTAAGTPVWQRPSFVAASEPRFHGNTLYASGGRGEVFALNPATGEPRWARTLGADSQLEVTGDTVCAGTDAKVMYGLDTADGRLKWVQEADLTSQQYYGDYATASLDGVFFVGVREGYVIALTSAASPGGSRSAGP